MDNAAGHHRRGRVLAKRFAWINQPLPAGVLVVLATVVTQQWGWRQQQQYLAQQAKTGLAIQQMQDVIKDTALDVGQVLTASAMLLGAHKERVGDVQLNATIDRYHDYQRTWDSNEDLLKYKIRNWFPKDVGLSWSKLLTELGELDEQVLALHQFSTADSSREHSKQMELVGGKIEDVEKGLATLTDQMTAYLRSRNG